MDFWGIEQVFDFFHYKPKFLLNCELNLISTAKHANTFMLQYIIDLQSTLPFLQMHTLLFELQSDNALPLLL